MDGIVGVQMTKLLLLWDTMRPAIAVSEGVLDVVAISHCSRTSLIALGSRVRERDFHSSASNPALRVGDECIVLY